MNQENTPNAADDQFTHENVRAEEAITSGNLPEAAGILVGIVEKDPTNARAFNNMGIISWTRQSWEDAFSMFKRAVQLKTGYTDALINLFDAGLKLRRVHEVLPFLNQALSVQPDNEELTIIRDSIIDQGDKIYTSPRALGIGIYSPILEEAKKLLEDGNLYKAMEKFIESNDKEGPNAESYCGLGIISYYQQRYSDAFSLFFESIKLNPTDPDTYLNLLDAAKESNNLKMAIDIFDLYRKQFPDLQTVEDEFEKARKTIGSENK